MPDGYSVSLDQFKGMNQIGDTRLRDQVNNHYFKIFGASLAVGASAGLPKGARGGVLTQSGTRSIQQGVGKSLGQTSQRILDKFLNILPTVTIREGHRVKIYLSGDLAVPDCANHRDAIRYLIRREPHKGNSRICARERKTAVRIPFSQPKYFTRSLFKPSRFSTLSISAKNDFVSSATEATFRMILRFFFIKAGMCCSTFQLERLW